MEVLQLAFAMALAAIHLFAGKLHRLDTLPRSAWLSFAGGFSVGYVFIHIFPELNAAHRAISDHGVLGLLEHNAYIVALLGLAYFYGLEHWVKRRSRKPTIASTGTKRVENQKSVFWVHVVAFAIYNALFGYLLVYRNTQLPSELFFFLAMGFHFLVNDYGLASHHRTLYATQGRWILAAAIVVGWAVGVLVEVAEAVTSLVYAFVAGGLILNVLKEELPEQRCSRFWPFAAGAFACTLLLTFA
ncbi:MULTISPECIES: hypothetical protein [Halomonadaceae]|uniref:hypothetical protein n=1 Tax=Halomonadaceae TaxID=28256 RepID=UPI00111BC480|nr:MULTISPECIES: hypothetical protein [Halomonas]MCG7589288.1 hypothetical protein [Halomonas sp. McD50-5]MCG7615449.1 hypothetical protein [Halomonas sp. McD50-4]TNH19793.1 hypothetical protein FHJ80_01045 [Halomonas sp. BL6]